MYISDKLRRNNMDTADPRTFGPTLHKQVYNNLLFAADGGQMSALCLLDLTVAFDTVDHALLIDRLERQFGLRDSVLEWFRSYLSGRTFSRRVRR